MNVLVVGSHGKIGKQVVSLLGQKGFHPVAMIRDKNQTEEMEALGGEVVLADLEEDFSHALENVDVIVFTAGSGGHTGSDKTELVDRLERKGITRFIMVSSMNADTPEKGPESMRHYYQAKGDADEKLASTRLSYTIIRPGRLLDVPGTGKIQAAERITGDRTVGIPRADVAQVIVAVINAENTYRKTFELLSGETPVEEAVGSL
ncbi:SDR family oxidoreductase [Brevibacillus borstelensis]|uniref:SDR family oxidoreductase n=1 Tax=Brevibacillus borstelensis TaxID=45462 RepID=UPI002E242CB6|nr:SDR family oxidoreductase [Brevibacillus borstelensis]